VNVALGHFLPPQPSYKPLKDYNIQRLFAVRNSVYGRGCELATNRREDQEMGLFCLHPLQSSLVYINTLMIQRVLADATWSERMTPGCFAENLPFMSLDIPQRS
jgi:hypothetical protein